MVENAHLLHAIKKGYIWIHVLVHDRIFAGKYDNAALKKQVY